MQNFVADVSHVPGQLKKPATAVKDAGHLNAKFLILDLLGELQVLTIKLCEQSFRDM